MRHDEEFTDFFAARAVTLRRTAYLIVGDWHAAEDVTQLGMARLYLVWPRIRQDTVEAYARRVIVNEALGWLRRHRREITVAALPDGAAATPGEQSIDFAAALALLPGRQRAVIALRFLDDLSVAEVARVLEIAEGTVKSQSARALDTLRAHIPDLVLTRES